MENTHAPWFAFMAAPAFEMCHTGPLNAAEHTFIVNVWPARALRLETLWMGKADNSFTRHVTCVSLEYRTLMTKKKTKKQKNKNKKLKIKKIAVETRLSLSSDSLNGT